MSSWTPAGADLWQLESRIRLAPATFLPLRSTAMRSAGGGLILHSPQAMDAEDLAFLRALGPVEHLIAPSALHHLFLSEAQAAFPDAVTWGPRQLQQTRPDLAIDHPIDDSDGLWQETLRRHPLRGAPRFSETVFVHPASSTLLVTDLVFHVLDPGPGGWMTPWLLRTTGTWNRLACSRAWHLAVDDREAFATSLRAVLEDPGWTHLLPAHGTPLEDARGPLRDALSRWVTTR